MAEGARLESVYTFIAYRGFESLSLRQIQRNRLLPVFLCRAPGIVAARSVWHLPQVSLAQALAIDRKLWPRV